MLTQMALNHSGLGLSEALWESITRSAGSTWADMSRSLSPGRICASEFARQGYHQADEADRAEI